MAYDTRFGLSLSLVEALKQDPSPAAEALVELLADEDLVSPPAPVPAAGRPWRTTLAAIALAAGVGSQAYAATPNLEGRWAMAPAQSSFREDVTGPAPDAASVTVTRDDASRLAYELVERRGGGEVARGTYDVSFEDGQSRSSVDGLSRELAAEKDARGDIAIRTPARGPMQVVIHLRRTGPDTALLEHDIEGPDGSMNIEKISLVRTSLRDSN